MATSSIVRARIDTATKDPKGDDKSGNDQNN